MTHTGLALAGEGLAAAGWALQGALFQGEQEAYKRSHAVPHSGTPFQPKLKHKHTVVEPFSFEGRPPAYGHSFREAEESMEKVRGLVCSSSSCRHS